MQLPLSSSSTDPSLVALLFPSATSNSPLGGPLISPGGEPVIAGFEQLFAELQPATPSLVALLFPSATSNSPLGGPLISSGGEPVIAGSAQLFAELQPATPEPIATAPKGAGPVAPVLPAPADPGALGNFPRKLWPTPALVHANVPGLALRVSDRSGLVSPAAKDPKEGVGPRSARLPAEPATKSGQSDESAAPAAVLAVIPTIPKDPLPVAVLPVSQSETSIGAQTSEDLTAVVTSAAVNALATEGRRSDQAEETSPFDAATTAFRRAPFGFGSEPQGRPLTVGSPQLDSGFAGFASLRPEPKPVLAGGDASIAIEDTPFAFSGLGLAQASGGLGPRNEVPANVTAAGGHARDVAPGRMFRDDSGTGANGLAIAQARSAFNSSEVERIKPRADLSRGQQAKSAETDLVSRVDLEQFESLGDKIFLTSQPKYVAEAVSSLGTGAANPHSVMVSFTNSAQSPAPSPHLGGIVTAVSEAGEIIEQASLSEPTGSSAQEAVDTVLDAADRMASRDQRSVDLDFTVGGAKLAVRVELQGGEVRTTFRTESPELRVALAHEWEAVAGGNEERAFRLAPPTITGTDTPARHDSFGDASSRQQERQQERESREALNVRDPAADGRARAGTTSTAMPAPRAPQFPSGTAQHLHQFA